MISIQPFLISSRLRVFAVNLLFSLCQSFPAVRVYWRWLFASAVRPADSRRLFISPATNICSTFWRAQGFFRKNLRLEFTVGSNMKHRIGMRSAMRFQPYHTTSCLMMLSSVTPCNGSCGCGRGDGGCEFTTF